MALAPKAITPACRLSFLFSIAVRTASVICSCKGWAESEASTSSQTAVLPPGSRMEGAAMDSASRQVNTQRSASARRCVLRERTAIKITQSSPAATRNSAQGRRNSSDTSAHPHSASSSAKHAKSTQGVRSRPASARPPSERASDEGPTCLRSLSALSICSTNRAVLSGQPS